MFKDFNSTEGQICEICVNNNLLNFELNFEQFLAERFPRSSAAHICTCTQQRPPPCRGGAGGEALPMYVYATYLFCLNMSKITFA